VLNLQPVTLVHRRGADEETKAESKLQVAWNSFLIKASHTNHYSFGSLFLMSLGATAVLK
jgi:hypothetical protein